MNDTNEITTTSETSASIPPPRLHWGWVFGLNAITAGLFYGVWLIVQSNWSRRVRGKSVAFPMSIVLLGAQLIFWCTIAQGSRQIFMLFGFVIGDEAEWLAGFLWLSAIIFRIANLYVLRYELEGKPVSLTLSAIMTFFFGPIYFQYHLRDFQGDVVSELQELNRCDGCKVVYHDFYGLSKVEGKGYLCEKCRLELA